MTNFRSTVHMQGDLQKIIKDYMDDINKIRSSIVMKKLEKMNSQDSEDIKQTEEKLKSLIKP